MAEPIELVAEQVQAVVLPGRGGRVARLRVADVDLFAGGPEDPLLWGCYPLAPWSGRVRHGRFRFDGSDHQLPLTMPPHALHGTVADRPWKVVEAGDRSVTLAASLGEGWPFGGTAHSVITVEPDGLRWELAVEAADRAMPAQVGWHPCFVKPVRAELAFARMYERDAEGIPNGRLVPMPSGPWDDCFVEPLASLRLEIGGLRVTIDSDCDHWVVFDQLDHTTCVEPQSGPPDGFTLAPLVLAPGERLTRWMQLRWS
jgi:aldose 1-epimerase